MGRITSLISGGGSFIAKFKAYIIMGLIMASMLWYIKSLLEERAESVLKIQTQKEYDELKTKAYEKGLKEIEKKAFLEGQNKARHALVQQHEKELQKALEKRGAINENDIKHNDCGYTIFSF